MALDAKRDTRNNPKFILLFRMIHEYIATYYAFRATIFKTLR